MAQAPDPKSVFVIHGRNSRARDEMGIFLRACGLTPLNFDDLRASLGGTPTIDRIVEEGMARAQGIIALFTPDEFAELRARFRTNRDHGEAVARWQARPNVIFEAGMAFGRDRHRVVFVLLGDPKLFTDVAGIHVLRPTNDPRRDRKVLRDVLENMKCAVERSGAWMEQGDFEGCVAMLPPVSPHEKVCRIAVVLAVLLVVATAIVAVLWWRNIQLQDQVASAGILDPNRVFPAFGPTIAIENKTHATMNWKLLGCESGCAGRAEKVLEIATDIRRNGGYGVLIFKKPQTGGYVDLMGKTVLLRTFVKTKVTTFEVALRDDAEATVFFHCTHNAMPATAEDFVIRTDEVARAFPEFHLDRVVQFSIGFAAGAGATSGHHEMQLFGAEVSSGMLRGTACHLRTPA